MSSGRVSQNSSQCTGSYLDDVSDMTEHIDAEETYYEVQRRSSPPRDSNGNKPPTVSKKVRTSAQVLESSKLNNE